MSPGPSPRLQDSPPPSSGWGAGGRGCRAPGLSLGSRQRGTEIFPQQAPAGCPAAWGSHSHGVHTGRRGKGPVGAQGCPGPLGWDKPRPEGPEARLGIWADGAAGPGLESGGGLGAPGVGGLTWRRRGPLGAAAVCRAPGVGRGGGPGSVAGVEGTHLPPEPGPCHRPALQSHGVRNSCPRRVWTCCLGELACDGGGGALP